LLEGVDGPLFGEGESDELRGVALLLLLLLLLLFLSSRGGGGFGRRGRREGGRDWRGCIVGALTGEGFEGCEVDTEGERGDSIKSLCFLQPSGYSRGRGREGGQGGKNKEFCYPSLP